MVLCAAGGPKGRRAPLESTEVIEALRPRGIFVTIARGWLVDEPALVDALMNGRLGAAGLEVFHGEPAVPTALLDLDNVVLTPHVASATEETRQGMGDCVVGNLVDWFAGKGAGHVTVPDRGRVTSPAAPGHKASAAGRHGG